jgi:uncharacterized protein
MKIGIISDTHDRLEKIDKAVAFFNSYPVELVMHAGDFVAPFTAQSFADLDADMVGVFGNNDGEKEGLVKAYANVAKLYEPPHIQTIDGLSIVILHKDTDIEKYLKQHDVIIYGHSHQYDIKKQNGKLIVNPGECCGYLSGMSTVAILDTKTKEAEIYQLQ